MRSLVLARLTADWMWRKRHFLSSRSRIRFVRARALPLKAFLIRRRELRLQTTSGVPVCPYFGTAPLDASGKYAWRSGWASAEDEQAITAPSTASSVHALLIRTGTYTTRVRRVPPRLLLVLVLALLVVPASASAKPRVEHLKFRYGPLTIHPGQNTISIDGDKVPRPKRSGWITGFRPNLEYTNGKIPGVDVIHLHHAVWLINGRPTFAAGEEKSNVRLPRGFGWRHVPEDRWVLNHMVHNLLPSQARVYLTYELDFIPDSSPLARKMRPVKTRWVDVQGGSAYPVFDVHRGTGAN